MINRNVISISTSKLKAKNQTTIDGENFYIHSNSIPRIVSPHRLQLSKGIQLSLNSTNGGILFYKDPNGSHEYWSDEGLIFKLSPGSSSNSNKDIHTIFKQLYVDGGNIVNRSRFNTYFESNSFFIYTFGPNSNLNGEYNVSTNINYLSNVGGQCILIRLSIPDSGDSTNIGVHLFRWYLPINWEYKNDWITSPVYAINCSTTAFDPLSFSFSLNSNTRKIKIFASKNTPIRIRFNISFQGNQTLSTT